MKILSMKKTGDKEFPDLITFENQGRVFKVFSSPPGGMGRVFYTRLGDSMSQAARHLLAEALCTWQLQEEPKRRAEKFAGLLDAMGEE